MELGDYIDMGPKPKLNHKELDEVQWPCCHTPPASHSSHVLTVNASLRYTYLFPIICPNYLGWLQGLMNKNNHRNQMQTACVLLLDLNGKSPAPHTWSYLVCRVQEWHFSTGRPLPWQLPICSEQVARVWNRNVWTGRCCCQHVCSARWTAVEATTSRWGDDVCSIVQQTWKVGAEGTGTQGAGRIMKLATRGI